jgi:hypothetical protein
MLKEKVAIQISGYLRTINDCIDSWSNIFDYDKYDYDFFIHTYKNYGFSKGFNFNDIEDDDLIDIDLLRSKINIKNIVIEEHAKYDPDIIHSGHDSNRVRQMFRKIYLCNEIYKKYCLLNGDVYKFVIRMRPDLFFPKKIDFNISGNTICVNKFAWGNDIVNGVVNDQFAICSNDLIDSYCGLFKEYDKYSNLQPEKALYTYLNSKKIRVEYFDFGYEIRRKK